MGYNYHGTVTNCYSSGTASGDYDVGGLVGQNWGDISNCYSSGTISGQEDIGGLVGHNDFFSSRVIYCYSTSNISGKNYVGGLIGNNQRFVTNSYSTGTVSGNEYIGGLVGHNSGNVIHCYSVGVVSGNSYFGGLVGWSGTEGVVSFSIWDTETSGLSSSDGGVSLTTAEMMDSYMLGLNGFANDTNWMLDSGNDYPRLVWQNTQGEMIPEPEINWLQGNGTTETPYQIEIPEQLIMLGKASILWDKDFILNADINLDPNIPNNKVFGQAVIPSFIGVFDGNNHSISNLVIDGFYFLGLFGRCEYCRF